MAIYNASSGSKTDLTNDVQNYQTDPSTIDTPSPTQTETYWDFPNAAEHLNYYKTIPELKKAIDALALWVVGKGFTTDARTEARLGVVRGWGEDSIISILSNLQRQKKIFGDAFAEIVWEDNRIVNIKPLYPGHMRVVLNAKGIITRYEQRIVQGKNTATTKFQPKQILHLTNERIGNEIHGLSVVDACKWVIDARHEAMTDYRKILHRQLALGILYVDTDNATEIAEIGQKYGDAVKNGEVLILPKDSAKLEDPNITLQNPIEWIRYLEGFFYQAVGIPRVIATSQEYSEASSKVGYLTFEPVYTAEQTELEADLWNQAAVKVKFNRPPSLTGVVAESEQKNTGQVGFQPTDTEATAGRVE